MLVGDFLYSRAFQMMVDRGQHAGDAGAGRRHQHHRRRRGAATAQLPRRRRRRRVAIFAVIRCKTAKLFEAGARLGAILGQASPQVEDGLARYGMHLGTAFQLIDDVLDYSGDEHATGKHLGDDLAGGQADAAADPRAAAWHGRADRVRAPCHRAGRAGGLSGASWRQSGPPARWTRRGAWRWPNRNWRSNPWRRCRIRNTRNVC
ncbi:MAG: polyprenyl synthetase family protein [Comamonadaceae bacterium]|nr:polyprenyl synthetase family protein [Comamonadaceae bacterium]